MPRTFNARAAESASASRHVKGYVLGRRERTGRVDFASDAARSSGPGRPAPTSSQRCLTARAGQARAVGRWKGRAVRLPAADGNGGNFDRAPPSHGDDAAANEAELFVVEFDDRGFDLERRDRCLKGRLNLMHGGSSKTWRPAGVLSFEQPMPQSETVKFYSVPFITTVAGIGRPGRRFT